MLAIFNLNFTELGVVLVGAIMVFGKDLPKVVMRGLQQFSKLRRSVTEMWREAGLEQEFKRVKAELEPEISEFTSAQRALKDGKSLMNGPVAHWRKSIGIDVEDVIEVGSSSVEENSDAQCPEDSNSDSIQPIDSEEVVPGDTSTEPVIEETDTSVPKTQ